MSVSKRVDPKSFLEQYKLQQARINISDMELDYSRSELDKLHTTLIDNDAEREKRDLVRTIEAYISYSEEKKKDAVMLRDRIIDVIDQVTDPDCKRLIMLRYMNGLTWETIAGMMFFSYEWTIGGLHRKALDHVAAILDQEPDNVTVN